METDLVEHDVIKKSLTDLKTENSQLKEDK